MPEELDNKEESIGFEKSEEDIEAKRERRTKIAWLLFFGIVIALMIVCVIAIKCIPA